MNLLMAALEQESNAITSTDVCGGLLKATKSPYGRFHALRHSFASALITDNQSPKLVQMLLGHHSAAFTMDVYSDLWPMALDGIGERIAATLFSGDGSKVVAEATSEGADTTPSSAQVIEINDGPCRDRTYDQEIKRRSPYFSGHFGTHSDTTVTHCSR